MSAFIEKLRVEWQSSPLLRWGALGVVLILAVYVWLVLGDVNRELEQELAGNQGQQRRLASMQDENFWPERAQQVRNMRVQLESQFWQADTKGLAQANLQSWLDRLLRRMSVTNMKMQIEDPVDVEALESIWQVDVLIEGALEPARLLELLNEIETSSQLTVVNSLDYEKQRFKIRLRTFVQSTQVGL